jgi:hypothetical protein
METVVWIAVFIAVYSALKLNDCEKSQTPLTQESAPEYTENRSLTHTYNPFFSLSLKAHRPLCNCFTAEAFVRVWLSGESGNQPMETSL